MIWRCGGHRNYSIEPFQTISKEVASAADVVEYTDCISKEGWDPYESPDNDVKVSDGEALAWEMWRTTSLTMLAGSLGPRVVDPDRALCMGQIE